MSIKKPSRKGRNKPGRPPQSGAYSLIVKGGDFPERRTYLREYLQSCRDGLVFDLGPREEDLTTAQRVLLDRAISKLGIVRCIEEHAKETGAFNGAELSSVLSKSYITYTESMRRDLEALGISKRAGERVLSPLEVAAEIDAGKAEAGQEAGPGVAAGPVAASADGPECTGKGEGDGKGGASRGKGRKRRAESPGEARSQSGEGQDSPGDGPGERSSEGESIGLGDELEVDQPHE